MTTRCVVLLLLAACGGKKEDKAGAANGAGQPATAESKPAETPAEKPAGTATADAGPDTSHGVCHVVGSGAVTFEQTTPNTGMSMFSVMQWHTPEIRRQLGYADEGFIMNCGGPSIELSVMTSRDKVEKVSFPMQPAMYAVGRGKGKQIFVLGSIKPAEGGKPMSILDAEGTLEITAFDNKHMAGKAEIVIAKTIPPASGAITLTLDFDLTCHGQGGCPK